MCSKSNPRWAPSQPFAAMVPWSPGGMPYAVATAARCLDGGRLVSRENGKVRRFKNGDLTIKDFDLTWSNQENWFKKTGRFPDLMCFGLEFGQFGDKDASFMHKSCQIVSGFRILTCDARLSSSTHCMTIQLVRWFSAALLAVYHCIPIYDIYIYQCFGWVEVITRWLPSLNSYNSRYFPETHHFV